MPRLRPNLNREVNTIKSYIGKAIIFCEGYTEYNYMEYFSQIISKRSKYTQIEVTVHNINIKGNAMDVYKNAEEFLEDEIRAKIYKDYDKYLIFDCDSPKNIQDVIQKIIDSQHQYKLLLTNLLFEVWLLMHFEIVDKPLGKSTIYKKMADKLGCLDYNSKEKANSGNIRKIIGNGDSVKNAIINAKNLENEYKDKCDELVKNIKNLNPYTRVHHFIEKVLYEIDNMNQKS